MVAVQTPRIQTAKPIINAVIGVWHDDARAYYVKRSDKMANYPGAWSLFSIQYDPQELPDSLDLAAVQRLMARMALQRLGRTPIQATRFLSAVTCRNNPIDTIVNLRLYELTLKREPNLNPEYYVDGAWMTPIEYVEHSANAICGSCIRMWSDYCYSRGFAAARFAPVIGGIDN